MHPAPAAVPDLLPRATALLERWAEAMEAWWTPVGTGQGGSSLGHYGLGHNHWGVQAAWRHCAALAVLAERGDPRSDHWRARARGELRFLLATHASGDRELPDGQRWGRTWISALALERAMHGVRVLEPHLASAERDALDRVLIAEAEYLCDGYERFGDKRIHSTRWTSEGGNHGESNVWNGCLLWRVAERLPGHPRNGAWRERAQRFLLNGVTVAADLADDRPVAGRPLKDWLDGVGLFDHYAFDHHGYLNVGYQVICVSNAAILHFDARIAGLSVPEGLHHHQADLWQVVLRTVFADGRLARIGGDSRVRYAYCQEYLVPAALYAADHLGDGHALGLLDGWLATAEREADFAGDGTFYGKRLEDLRVRSPGYWLRLESDRACALSLLLAYLPVARPVPAVGDAEASRAGAWSEPEHGAVLHRSPTRLAAFAWRAFDLAQGTCQPPADGDLAEWSGNLVGTVAFADLKPENQRRKLIAHAQTEFAGGFLTWGRLALGCGCAHEDSWSAPADGQAVHHLAFATLPDDRTVLAIEVARVGSRPAVVRSARALHLNLPNDCFNGSRRRLATARGGFDLAAGEEDGVIDLGSRWAQLAPGLACIGLTGGTALGIDRSRVRRGGAYRSLHVEEVGWGAWHGTRRIQPGSDLIDASWLVRCAGDAAEAAALAAGNADAGIPAGPDARAVRVVLPDGRCFILALNLVASPVTIAAIGGRILGGDVTVIDGRVTLPAYGAALVACP